MDSGDHEHSEQSEEDLSEDEKVSQNESENNEVKVLLIAFSLGYTRIDVFILYFKV